MSNNNIVIKGIIDQKIVRVDKNGRNYLIIKLRNKDDAIFVFSSRVVEDKWDSLEVDGEYNFTVQNGRDDRSNVLIEFESSDL